MPQLILIAFLCFGAWLIRRDTARREGISAALWIPSIWVGILASRPLSAWMGVGGGVDTLEGSPLDRLFYFGFILAAFVVLARRNLNWGQTIKNNWPVFLFYGYFLFSTIWAESTVVSFKRLFKDFGNIPVALVILTEVNPSQAFRAVFVRSGYMLIPLSIIFLRYFPDIGRTYNIYTGEMEATGVTFQKNSLGAMVLICSLVLIWDWIERSKTAKVKPGWFDRYLPLILLGLGANLLKTCDSKTSIACLILGAGILLSIKVPFVHRKIGALGGYALAGMAGAVLLDSVFGIRETLLGFMGRDATLTGRTDVWRELLSLNTDPVFGIGFCSFWSNRFYLSQLSQGIGASAHNGYLEMYLDGGLLGVLFLLVLLLVTALRINRQLKTGSNFALMHFSVLVVTLIGNISESHYGRMAPLWFMFLLVAMDSPFERAAKDYSTTEPKSVSLDDKVPANDLPSH